MKALKMKDLQARTGVSRESIHFYLREGLLPPPERPKRNVAHYSEEHVVRLQVIKRLQEERNLPLRDIREMLAGADFGAVTTGDDVAAFEYLFLSLINGDLPSGDRAVADVATESGLTREHINALVERGIVTVRNHRMDFRDAGIVRAWARMQAAGFAGKPGYGIEFLERYAEVTRMLADIEVEAFLSAFADLPTDDAAETASTGVEVANELLARLHVRALAAALRARVRENEENG